MKLSEFISLYGLKLNDSQMAAVTARGNTLLLAVPGSGKTTAIISRVGHLICCQGVSPSEILTITYTSAAAKDMNKRFSDTFPGIAMPKFCTINSFCLSVLRLAQKKYAIHIPELMTDNTSTIRAVYRDMTGDYASEGIIRSISSGITYTMNMTGCGRDERSLCSDIRVPKISFYDLYQKYKSYKSEGGLMDFDDQLLMAYSVLTGLPDVLESITSMFKYINVDEAQDTSFIQHRIIKLISEKNGNLFMVGDEDQSIYGFRAAYPQALLNFKNEYKNSRVLLMETNYRSTGSIISAANKFIGINKNRQKKKMNTENEKGATVKRIQCATFAKQGEFVARYLKNNEEKKTVAVLFRNNDSAVPFIYYFEKFGVDYVCKDSSALFFTSFLVKEIMTLIIFSQDMMRYDLFEKICYRINLYVTKDDVVQGISKAKKEQTDVFTALYRMKDDDRFRTRIHNTVRTLTQIKNSRPNEAIRLILDDLGYEKKIKQAVNEGYNEDVLRHKLAVLMTVAEAEPTLESFVGKMSDIAHGRLEHRKTDAMYTLSTVHSAKGLEFDEVIVADAIDGIFPSDGAEDELLEEERRLFYVAVTRARRELGFLVSGSMNGKKIAPSPFIKSFIETAVSQTEQKTADKKPGKAKYKSEDFAEGSLIHHKVFGDGVITTIDGDVIMVHFFSRGDKRLSMDVCISSGYIELT